MKFTISALAALMATVNAVQLDAAHEGCTDCVPSTDVSDIAGLFLAGTACACGEHDPEAHAAEACCESPEGTYGEKCANCGGDWGWGCAWCPPETPAKAEDDHADCTGEEECACEHCNFWDTFEVEEPETPYYDYSDWSTPWEEEK